MRRILKKLMFAIALVAMCVPSADAQRHNGAKENKSRTEHSGRSSRQSGDKARSGSTQARRPSGVGSQNGGRRSQSNKGTASRPNNGAGNNSRPNVGNRPVNNRPDHGDRPNVGNRPGNSRPNPGVRPGGSHRPNHGLRPGGHPAPRPPMIRPPHRPHRPVMVRPHYRPVPPPAWRPHRGVPVIRGILGLSFGVAIGTSLDYLYNSGYSVDGYANDIVYLRNVPALNYVWTDAALYYGSRGLDASSFYYSTSVYDMSRYNSVYSDLVSTYGVPVSVNNAGGMLTSTWFGGNRGYITLSFGSGSAGRFLTTLTLGL
ncbi:hypothetical protein [uncultured Duncaniella sp.]|uniref:hypothetical protein n=1 Tax=uncultured Duncaniella sp. TaxID=2768039 RepID=UPI0026705609|nr:hypothetical protein [uncultured Duncaniella sp.]